MFRQLTEHHVGEATLNVIEDPAFRVNRVFETRRLRDSVVVLEVDDSPNIGDYNRIIGRNRKAQPSHLGGVKAVCISSINTRC